MRTRASRFTFQVLWRGSPDHEGCLSPAERLIPFDKGRRSSGRLSLLPWVVSPTHVRALRAAVEPVVILGVCVEATALRASEANDVPLPINGIYELVLPAADDDPVPAGVDGI